MIRDEEKGKKGIEGDSEELRMQQLLVGQATPVGSMSSYLKQETY